MEVDNNKIYYGFEKPKPVEKGDFELIKNWIGEGHGMMVVNFGGANEAVNATREEVKKEQGKYLVVDPSAKTEVVSDNVARVRGSLEQFIEGTGEKNEFHSIIDDLNVKVDVIELNYLIGRMPIFEAVGDALDYFEKILKPEGKIIIRNPQKSLHEYVDFKEIERLGWEIKEEGMTQDDFDSEYVRMMGRAGSVKVTLLRKDE